MPIYRKLWPIEIPAYRDHLLRLDETDRLARFLAPTPDSVIRRHVGATDLPWTLMIGAFIDGILRGVVELRGSRDDNMRSVELAVSVERAFQNTGAGSELVRRAVLAARNRSVREITMICLPQNRRMQRICGKLKGLLDFDEADVVGKIAVESHSQFSLWQELAGDGVALGAALLTGVRPPLSATRSTRVRMESSERG